MRPRTLAGLALALTTAAVAQESVNLTLNWLEVVAGTNSPVAVSNGILEPGESARFSISILITPPIGSPVTYTPPPPPGTGTLAGLGVITMDLFATGPGVPSVSAAGDWGWIMRDPAWALGNAGQSTSGGSSVEFLQAGQFLIPGSTANSTNPIPNIWHGVWTPAAFTTRTVSWTLHPSGYVPSAHSVLVRYGTDPFGHPQYVGKFVGGTYGSTTIPIIPAPAAFLVLAPLLARRRRRGLISPSSRA